MALAWLAAMAAVAMLAAAHAAELAGTERAVKAAFLYKFLGYVEYPAPLMAPEAAYVIGVAEADDIAAELMRITEGRTLNNRAVQVQVVHSGDSVAGLHLLFIGGDGARVAGWLKAGQQPGLLSVTESAGGLPAGSVINFRLIDNRVRFEVSLDAAEKNNLKLSSRLLSVAYAVQKGGS
ncbi:MAG TPA: YfiR family protein [Duganella sp.]|nr:YfiR family protein [Duganella sp.]